MSWQSIAIWPYGGNVKLFPAWESFVFAVFSCTVGIAYDNHAWVEVLSHEVQAAELSSAAGAFSWSDRVQRR